MADKVRVDKWLWAVRIFKSRTIASDACKQGKVRINGVSVKPAQMLAEGEEIVVKKSGFDLRFRAIRLIDKRVGAPIAVACYQDLTPPEELNKYKAWFVGKKTGEFRDKGAGRPTKRERREIDQFKDTRYDE